MGLGCGDTITSRLHGISIYIYIYFDIQNTWFIPLLEIIVSTRIEKSRKSSNRQTKQRNYQKQITMCAIIQYQSKNICMYHSIITTLSLIQVRTHARTHAHKHTHTHTHTRTHTHMRISPDITLCGWLGSKHQLTNMRTPVILRSNLPLNMKTADWPGPRFCCLSRSSVG